MDNQTIVDTQPVKLQKKKGFNWKTWLMLIALILIMGGSLVVSLTAGYRDGRTLAQEEQATRELAAIQEQYQLGIGDLEAGRLDLARQRFEFVLASDPGFPGAADRLAETLHILYATATPTLLPPTATPSPTPDLRPIEELLSAAVTHFQSGDWSATIDTLLNLRAVDPAYHAAEVDSLMYRALRYRGIGKIQLEADLEGGIFDLSLAERFGPLDKDANAWRNLARLYMIGSSFWEVVPEQAVYYFGQVAASSPYLRDASGWTARERYRAALIYYGDKLASLGDWCAAEEQYALALSVRSDAAIIPTATNASLVCSPPTSTPTITPTLSLTPTWTLVPSATATNALPSPSATPPVPDTPTPTLPFSPTGTPTPEVTATPIPSQVPSSTPIPSPIAPSPTAPPATAISTPTPTPTPTLGPSATASSKRGELPW